MKKVSLIAVAALAVSAGSAFAGDLPSDKSPPPAPVVASPWGFDVGGELTSDYIWRGITQSNHQPSVWGHGELQYNFDPMWQGYIGVSGESIKFSPNYFPVGSPAMELDGDAGLRATIGNFGFDLGGIVYGYPDSPIGYHQDPRYGNGTYPSDVIGLSPRNPTFFEVYLKPTYTVNSMLTIGANEYYSPSFLNTGAWGDYLSGTVKVSLPGELSGFTVSGEIGYQWLGKVDSVYSGNNPAGYYYVGYANGQLPSYAAWNAGISYNWKFVTLDVRYYGTSLSSAQAYILTGIPDAINSTTSNYGDNAIVGTISFDFTQDSIK